MKKNTGGSYFNLTPFYRRGITGKGVTVAVLDTGIFPHEDFLFPQNKIRCFRDFTSQKNSPYDDNGHGTHVCGIIASGGHLPDGSGIGIAPEASLAAMKVLDRFGSGKTTDMVRGIDWILLHRKEYGIRIVNISVGMPVKPDTNPEEDILVKRVEALWDAGLVVVVAAGNEGPRRYSITSPGISKKVITVGALENGMYENGSGKSPLYSGCGPVPGTCVCKPDLVAPADRILSCDNKPGSYVRRSGTSMATPIVSGVIALLLSASPWLSNLDVKIRLMKSCLDCGVPRHRQGWGAINPHRLLDFL